jgi:flavin reductase (DIM6/NTAB) family NADH-FMN oxidoreductase RutF
MKIKLDPWTALFPCPVVLVTCVDSEETPNIITLAWCGVACSKPPMLSFGIQPPRYSYRLIEHSGELVVNIPTVNLVEETDFCGTISGKDVDKFSQTKLTPVAAEKVKPPLIKECPVNIESIVKKKVILGSHHLFLCEVVQVHVDQRILKENGKINFNKATPFVYNQGEYWSLEKKLAPMGFAKKSM